MRCASRITESRSNKWIFLSDRINVDILLRFINTWTDSLLHSGLIHCGSCHGTLQRVTESIHIFQTFKFETLWKPTHLVAFRDDRFETRFFFLSSELYEPPWYCFLIFLIFLLPFPPSPPNPSFVLTFWESCKVITSSRGSIPPLGLREGVSDPYNIHTTTSVPSTPHHPGHLYREDHWLSYLRMIIVLGFVPGRMINSLYLVIMLYSI